MIPIKGYSTFHPLKHCIVGRAHSPDDVSDDIKEIMHNTGEDIDNLVKTLESMGVVCHRPVIENTKERPPISPRDYFISIGENLFVGKVIAGYKDILKSIDRSKIQWYLGNDISSGNMIRCGDHIHWDVSVHVKPESEKKILQWLEQNGYRVTVTRHGWHMDGVYSILKPGVIVASGDLPELESIYPKWDIFYAEPEPVATPVQHQWGGNHKESNYDVNILSVDEKHCILTMENKTLFKFLEKNKINPIVCRFRDKPFWDNGIHCLTQDLYREGERENYF